MSREVIFSPEVLITDLTGRALRVQTHPHCLFEVMSDDVTITLAELSVAAAADGARLGLDYFTKLASIAICQRPRITKS